MDIFLDLWQTGLSLVSPKAQEKTETCKITEHAVASTYMSMYTHVTV